MERFGIGKEVFWLSEYNWFRGRVLRINKKSIALEVLVKDYHGLNLVPVNVRVKPEEIAMPDECVAIVWERWAGVNGRGRYRVERDWYPESRIPAKDIPVQHGGPGRVDEECPPWLQTIGDTPVDTPVDTP